MLFILLYSNPNELHLGICMMWYKIRGKSTSGHTFLKISFNIVVYYSSDLDKMNGVLVALCLFVVAVAAETGIRERRLFFIKRCSSENDCGPNRCCLFNRYCAPKLRFKYAPCHLSGITQCGCRDGLECRVTKEFNILGQRVQLRQCMEAGRELEVERLEDEDVKEMTESREKRFLIDRCSSESDCGDNRCCLFGKFCARKIPEGMTCYLTHKHKCGCQNGLVCKVTATITIPIIGSKIPIRQCVRE